MLSIMFQKLPIVRVNNKITQRLKCSGIDCEIGTFYSWLPKHSKGITKLFTEYPLGINKNEITIQKLRSNSCNNFVIFSLPNFRFLSFKG